MKNTRFLAMTLLGLLISSAALAQKVSFEVVCDEPSVSERIQKALEHQLKLEGLEMSDSLPEAKLFLFAQRTTSSRVNKNGWTFAIAHVSNQKTYYVAGKLIDSNAMEVKEIKDVLISMIQENGFLTYLNVIHTDDLSEYSLSEVANNAATALSKRVKP